MELQDFNPTQDGADVDVLVIGGGAAGLNGALQLVRQRRSVLVVDAGEPRNAPAAHMQGYLGHDGLSPAELLARGRDEVAGYGGVVRRGRVESLTGGSGEFMARISVGGTGAAGTAGAAENAGPMSTVRARRVLVTTGLVDELPQVEGLAPRWGKDVVHCPYYHGWEVRDKSIAVLASGANATHQALLFRQLSDNVVLVPQGADPSEEQLELMRARGIRMAPASAVEVLVSDDAITGLRLADGSLLSAEVVTVGTRMVAKAGFLSDLGLEAQEHPSGMGEYLPSGMGGSTAVPGVWLAGNVTDLSAQVGAAAAAGAMAGAQINAQMVMEEANAAVAALAARA